MTTPLPPRLSYWDFGGRLQRLEDTSFTKEDAREMEAERKKEDKEMEAERKKDMQKMEAERKKENKEMEAERKKDMQKMAETVQTNFMISTSISVASLFFSLAAKFPSK